MPFPSFGPAELAIIMVIVLIIFGAGKFAGIGGALGKSVRDFKKEMSGDEQAKDASTTPSVPKSPSATRAVCRSCGTSLAADARFCPSCGTSVVIDAESTTPRTQSPPSL